MHWILLCGCFTWHEVQCVELATGGFTDPGAWYAWGQTFPEDHFKGVPIVEGEARKLLKSHLIPASEW